MRWQAIGEAHPTNPVPEVGMVSGRNRGWVVEAAGGHVQLRTIAIKAKRQLRPTAWAKFSSTLRGRSVLRRRTRGETEVACRNGAPGNERGPLVRRQIEQ